MTYAPGKNACQRKVKERRKNGGTSEKGVFLNGYWPADGSGAEERRAGENGRLCARGPLGRGTVAKA